jgi:serine protease Do
MPGTENRKLSNHHSHTANTDKGFTMMKKLSLINLALSVLLIVTLTLGTACGLSLGAADSTNAGTSDDGANPAPVYTGWAATTNTESAEGQSAVLPTIADVVAAVKPSVVAIDTEVTINIFRRSFTQEGAGSGWIIAENGVIVTNSHVVEGARTISVTLDDGRVFTVNPNTVAIDTLNDLAVLQIDTENLPALNIGDSSELRVGDWVVTIGNPLGLGISAKEGIVSRLNVSLAVEGQALIDFIETSAAINPGNSGGPLVNMGGEVVGITSAKISSVGVEGLGYAISINKAMPIIEELLTGM